LSDCGAFSMAQLLLSCALRMTFCASDELLEVTELVGF